MTEIVDIDALLDAEEAKGPGDSWKPETPGEQIQGTVTEIKHIWVEKSHKHLPAVVLETPEGDSVDVVASRDILRDELLAKQVQVGDLIGVRYLGQPEGKRYFRYAVANGAYDKKTKTFTTPRDPEKAFTVEPSADDDFTSEAQAQAGPGF